MIGYYTREREGYFDFYHWLAGLPYPFTPHYFLLSLSKIINTAHCPSKKIIKKQLDVYWLDFPDFQ
jgi:hypothetical protein